MADKPVHPLTLYRLTLETDDEFAFLFFKDFFRMKSTTSVGLGDFITEQKKKIIGVESRVRERIIE